MSWLFTEIPDIYTWIGAAIVFTSSFYIAYRESVVRRERTLNRDDTKAS